jgi:acetylglutamate kinase
LDKRFVSYVRPRELGVFIMIVIKYGGHALPKPGVPDPMLKAISDFHNSGEKVVLVHGGGPQIDAELSVHQIASEMVGGYRPTTPEVFEVVQKVLSGDILRTLVNQLIGFGSKAVGLSASDGAIIRVSKMLPLIDGKEIDIGLVGDVESTDPKLLNLLLDAGFLPVVSPVATTTTGQGMNLNADIAAGAIGGALTADEVIFMTDVPGIYRSFPDTSSLITTISATELKVLAPSFSAGMVPKVKAALSALAAGANSVRIIDGRDISNLSAAFVGHGGTVVTP